jgi:hypothetical protein
LNFFPERVITYIAKRLVFRNRIREATMTTAKELLDHAVYFGILLVLILLIMFAVSVIVDRAGSQHLRHPAHQPLPEVLSLRLTETMKSKEAERMTERHMCGKIKLEGGNETYAFKFHERFRGKG